MAKLPRPGGREGVDLGKGSVEKEEFGPSSPAVVSQFGLISSKSEPSLRLFRIWLVTNWPQERNIK